LKPIISPGNGSSKLGHTVIHNPPAVFYNTILPRADGKTYSFRHPDGFTDIGKEKMASVPKRNAGNILVLSITLLIIFSVFTIRYGRFIRGFRGYHAVKKYSYTPRAYEELTVGESLDLGWAHGPGRRPEGSYLEHDTVKPPGKLRIGTFGCSFTRGEEAAAGHEYPSFLRKTFQAGGFENLEVINFGNRAYGNHQSYLLWKYLGRKYDLDYIVFMPFSWHVDRDNTFIFGNNSYGPLHARLVIKEGELKLLSVLGESRRESIEIYHRLFMPWRYLRHDREAPPFLRALLPRRRRLTVNPFYYWRGDGQEEEILDSYALIFQDIARNGESLVVISNDETIYNLHRQVEDPRVQFFRSRTQEFSGSFDYQAPRRHPSALGNRMRAEELFDFLAGEKTARMETVDVLPKSGCRKGSFGRRAPLYRYARAYLGVKGDPVSGFFMAREGTDGFHGLRRADFRRLRIASLLQVEVQEGRFVGLPYLLEEGRPVSLALRLGGEIVEIPLGEIRERGGVLGLILSPRDGPEIRKTGDGWSVDVNTVDIRGGVRIQTGLDVDDVTVRIGGRPALVGKETGQGASNGKEGVRTFSLYPDLGGYILLRSTAGQFMDPEQLKEKEGTFRLILQGRDGRRKRIPAFIGYRVVRKDFPPFEETCRIPVRGP
jgi:hypothetical protein